MIGRCLPCEFSPARSPKTRAVPLGRRTARNAIDEHKIARDENGLYPVARRSEDLLSTRENIVERILKVRRRVRELTPHLTKILLIALLNLFFEQLLEGAIA